MLLMMRVWSDYCIDMCRIAVCRNCSSGGGIIVYIYTLHTNCFNKLKLYMHIHSFITTAQGSNGICVYISDTSTNKMNINTRILSYDWHLIIRHGLMRGVGSARSRKYLFTLLITTADADNVAVAGDSTAAAFAECITALELLEATLSTYVFSL